MNKYTKLNWGWLGLLACGAAQAADIDAAAILNKYRQEMAPGYFKQEMPAVDAARYEEFRGMDVLGLPEAAQAVVMEFTGAHVGQRVVLQAMVSELERVLQDRGFAYVLQPLPDDGKQFLPTLKATQVKFGKVRLEPGSPLDPELAQAVLAHGLVSGEPVDRRQLERNSSVLSETAGVASAYRMVPGDGYGVTDLQANLSATAPRTGSVTLDNAGSESLGRANLRADLALQNRLGMGDVLRVYGLKSRGSHMVGVDASWLATTSGWRLGGSLSRFEYDYNSVAQTAQARNTGHANNLGLYVVYPWVRHEFGRHTLSLNLDQSSTVADSLLNGVPARLSDQHLQKFSASVYGIQALPDAYTGSYQLVLHGGHVRQDIATVAIEDSAGPRQMGHFAKVSGNAALSRQFDVSGRPWLATLSTTFQLSNRNLPGAEKISLGGMNQMRAWAPQSLSVDEALYTELRLETPLGRELRVGPFVEWVSYRQNHSNYTGTANFDSRPTNSGRMSDWGLSGTWQIKSYLVMRASVARKSSVDPLPNGKPLLDQSTTRGWASLTWSF